MTQKSTPLSQSQTADQNLRLVGWMRLLLILALAVAVIVIVVMLLGFAVSPFWLWLIFIGVMAVLLMALGLRVKGRVLGVLIDSRNRISLARLQTTLWTILVLSAFLAIALPRTLPEALSESRTIVQPLNITIPTELLAALGLSAASLAGSSFIKSNKAGKETRLISELQHKVAVAQAEVSTRQQELSQLTNEISAKWSALKAEKQEPATVELQQQKLRSQVEQARAELGQAEQNLQASQQSLRALMELPRSGVIKLNWRPTEASLLDLFTGDEVGNFDQVDLSKVQMFAITLVILVAYGAGLYNLLLDQGALFNPVGVWLPALSASLSTLLAISHGGYLAVKAVDHSKTVG